MKPALTAGATPHTQLPASVGRLTILAEAGMFVFGIVLALVGAVVPALSGRLPLTPSDIGTLFLAMNFAIMVASLVAGLAMDRFGLRLPLAAGAGLVAVGLLVIASASHYTTLLVAVAGLGLGGGALNAGTNTLVADLHDDPHEKAAALNLLGVFFGFGALLIPFSLGALTARLGVGRLLAAAAGLCAIVALATAMSAFPVAKQRHGWPLANMSRFARTPVIATLALLLFFESGTEFLLGGYVSTYLTRDLKVSLSHASYWLAGFWGAIMAGRFIVSRASRAVGPQRVVIAGALLSAIGSLIIATSGDATVAGFGALLAGFALAGIFPSVLGFTGARFPEHSGTVFGLLFTVALCGGMTMPWLAGHLAEAAGLRWVFVMATGGFVAVATLMAVARRAS